jgi:hypothetical protein
MCPRARNGGCPVDDSVKHEGIVRHGLVPNSQGGIGIEHELTPTSEKSPVASASHYRPRARQSLPCTARGGIFPPPNRMPKAELDGGVLFAEPHSRA